MSLASEDIVRRHDFLTVRIHGLATATSSEDLDKIEEDIKRLAKHILKEGLEFRREQVAVFFVTDMKVRNSSYVHAEVSYRHHNAAYQSESNEARDKLIEAISKPIISAMGDIRGEERLTVCIQQYNTSNSALHKNDNPRRTRR